MCRAQIIINGIFLTWYKIKNNKQYLNQIGNNVVVIIANYYD